MNNPLVSIITSVYNAEQHIQESIESIEAQTLKEWEWIIINDGSTDNSFQIAQEFAEKIQTPNKQIVLIDNSDNKKIPTRRNQAIAVATGKYIAIHDADDISLPQRFELQLEFLENNDCDCVGSHAKKINLLGEEIGDMNYPPEIHAEIFSMTARKCMNPMIDPTTMFLRETFLKADGYSLEKEIYTVPDFDLWTKVLLSGRKFANIQNQLIKYRANPDGMTQKHKKEMIHAHMVVWSRFMNRLGVLAKNENSYFNTVEKHHMKQIYKLQEIKV